jgi:hypothetical protein
VPQGAWCQDELIGGKLPVETNFDFKLTMQFVAGHKKSLLLAGVT